MVITLFKVAIRHTSLNNTQTRVILITKKLMNHIIRKTVILHREVLIAMIGERDHRFDL